MINDPNLLSGLSELISSLIGLHFPADRLSDLERGLRSAAPDLGFSDTSEFIEWLKNTKLSKSDIETLASHLTIGETYFFREKESFKALEETILPEIINARRGKEQRLRFWSAGCSTGEEAYSLAILITRMLPDYRDWNISILATDINPRSLKKAAGGTYSEWAFREAPEWLKAKYFMQKDGYYEIVPEIKKMVSFSYLNLAEDTYPSLLNNTNAMDVIFCRNVLMYFSTEKAKRAVQGFYKALVDEGWLSVSATESLRSLYSQFAIINFPGAILYRKTNALERREDFKHTLPEHTFNFRAESYSPVIDTGTEFAPVIAKSISASKETENPQEAVPTYKVAFELFEQGRYSEAIEALELLHQAKPDEAIINALLAKTNANLGKLDSALQWCEKAVEADKLNPAFRYMSATILQEQGLIEQAINSLKRALYLDPNFIIAYFVLGNLMLSKGDAKAAMKSFNNAKELLLSCGPEETLPESDGITAGRLATIIDSMALQRA